MNPTELNESNTFAAWQNPLNFASPRFGRALGRNLSEQTNRMELLPAHRKGGDRNGGQSQREERIPSFAGISHTREVRHRAFLSLQNQRGSGEPHSPPDSDSRSPSMSPQPASLQKEDDSDRTQSRANSGCSPDPLVRTGLGISTHSAALLCEVSSGPRGPDYDCGFCRKRQGGDHFDNESQACCHQASV